MYQANVNVHCFIDASLSNTAAPQVDDCPHSVVRISECGYEAWMEWVEAIPAGRVFGVPMLYIYTE